MVRSYTKFKIGRRRRDRSANSYEKMMKTLLLQNQQIIIQQQNMMFMVMKQLQQPQSSNALTGEHQQHNNSSGNQHHHNQQSQPHQHNHSHQQHQHNQQHHQPQQTQHNLEIQHQHSQYHHIHEDQSLHSHELFSQATASSLDTQHQLQQVASQLQENLGNYLTPAASEQDPINDKQGEDDLVALIEGDGLLQNNLLYNPQTDIGSITPYKAQQQQQTPSYYSSGCESLSTPRVEQQRQPTTTNINQNVVKNLADSFKSPSKPKINVQILSGSATGSMKNSKAKIIQRMNISEFLRHVHPENDEPQKHSTQ